MTKRLFCILTLILIFLPLLSADTRGRIEGKVVDEKDEPVADVTITLKNTKYEDSVLETKTDEKGKYEYAGLTPDIFIVTAEKEGYATIKGEQKIRMGYTVTLDFVMPSLEAMQEMSTTPRDVAAAAYNKALDYVEQGNDEEAIKQFLVAIENEEGLGKDLYRAYKSMGTVFYKNNRLEDAEKSFVKVTELNPEDLPSFVTLGEIYNKMKDTDLNKYDYYIAKAIQIWEKAYDLSIEQGVKDASIPFNIGVLYTQTSDSDTGKAIEWFKKTLEIDENNQEAHKQIVLQYIANPEITEDKALLEEAKKSLESYITKYPDDVLTPTFKDFLNSWK